MTGATTERLPGPTPAAKDTLLIDTDVHENLKTPLQLLPYLDAHWQTYWGEHSRNVNLPTTKLPYTVPTSGVRREWVLEDGTHATDLDAMRRHLFEEEGVSVGILNNFMFLPTTASSPEYVTAVARAYTDWQIAEWLDKEPRLRGSVYVRAHEPEAAAREIDRAAAHPQIVQVYLPTVTDREYGDPFYRPIFEAAVRNELVVTFHHGLFTETVLGYPRYFIHWHNVVAQHATANQLTSMICNGLFDKYPELKVVFLETGVGWVAPFVWRLDEQYRELRSEIPWVKRKPSDHMRDSVRFSTQPMGDITPRQFSQLVEMAELERLFMFSTDYAHYDADSAVVALPGTLPDDLRERVRYRNALETFPRLAGLDT